MNLFTPVVKPQQLHPNFCHLMRPEEAYTRDVLISWATGFTDRDGKFVREFQTTFNSSFWELYLFACLKELKLTPDFMYSSPDFVVTAPTPFCIEATTANHAHGATPEWERSLALEDLEEVDLEIVVDLATIRLANAIVAKHRKYLSSYATLGHVQDKPFVIAIAPFEQPWFVMQNQQAMQRVLYGYERPLFTEIPGTDMSILHGHEYIDAIEKPNGALVPLGCFISEEMRNISAVIFSNTATISKARALSSDPCLCVYNVLRYNEQGFVPRHEIHSEGTYHETVLDGLHVFHNPHAQFPLAPDIFRHRDVTQHWFDLDQGMPVSEQHDGFLIQRWSHPIYTIPDENSTL